MATRIHGLILAGGLSRRMGHDKALLTLCGRNLLTRVAERLEPQCRGLVVSRHPGGAELPTSYPIVADADPERLGPLGGLLAGLDWISRTDGAATHAVSVPVDVPFLPMDLVERLDRTRRNADARLALASSNGRRHPVVAIWPVAIRDDLRVALHEGKLRRVAAFLERHDVAVAAWRTESGDPFFNINTPADLVTAEAMMGRGHAVSP